ncbi:MAG TPA: M14 family zinc carboxypeptidase, partial [Chitinophagaceae bacterium]|nr:M14 family zinc carboxypeptidase [Chitinophagaceae bacterium]
MFLLLFLFLTGVAFSQSVSQKYLDNKTVTYDEAISFYQQLDSGYEKAKLLTYGLTDSGKPLHLFVISSDVDFNPASLHKKNKRIILINNAIHPGEPDGVDASIKWCEDILKRNLYDSLLKNTVVCIIPVYNIDGALNRGCCNRANQNGPEEYGTRANGQNLDLNRDFIKCETMNTRSFIEIFQVWDPDIFIDTHVSDGADYQYVMTLISSQHDKLTPVLGTFMKNTVTPFLFAEMKRNGNEMTPYVNTINEIPDDGIAGFLETPRFSTGYAALFNTLGFVTETHMFKPYKERVEATAQFFAAVLKFTSRYSNAIFAKRKEAKKNSASQKQFPLSWTLDTTQFETISFKGFEAKHKPSSVTGLQRLYYDRNAAFVKPIKFFDAYKSDKVDAPYAYVIPQAWNRVIERLKWNGIEMKKLERDTMLDVEVYYITDFKTPPDAYEGKYLHSDTQVRKEKQQLQYLAGDYIIELNQPRNRYIVETLEPQATDSYFSWGFFDAILQQKEWFSDYVFEDTAAEILKNNPSLKAEF